MFRPATADDVEFILELLREFYRKAGSIYVGIAFDGPSTIATIAHVVARGVCIVGPSSCAGAVIAPFEFNHHARIANVVFWCFKSAREIVILNSLIEACKRAGATHVAAASQFPHNAIGRRYRRLGFTFCEQKAFFPL